VKAGGVAGLAAWNPVAGAIAAQVLGISLGKETKDFQEFAGAVKSSFPGGEFAPNAFETALRGMVHPKAEQALSAVLEKYLPEPKAANARKQAEDALARIVGSVKPDLDRLANVLQQAGWDSLVGTESTAD
jgi:hypothetical protein